MASYYIGSREANPSPTVAIHSSKKEAEKIQSGTDQKTTPNDTGMSLNSIVPTKSGRKETNSFKTMEDASWKLTPFRTSGYHTLTSFSQDPCQKSQKIKSHVYGPCEWGESSHFRSTDGKVGSTRERTALERSTTKRIQIQPHLRRARFNIHQEYQGSSSFIPQQLWLYRRHVRRIRHQNRSDSPTSSTWKMQSPIKYKDEIEKELGEMVQQGIIAKQTEPTLWVSSLTYPKKANGKLRICLEPKYLNKAIIQENHKAPIPWGDCTCSHRSRQILQSGQQQSYLQHEPYKGSIIIDNIHHSSRKIRILVSTIWTQDEPGHFQDANGWHCSTMSWSTGNPWWHIHVWERWQRSWCKHHQSVQCSPKRGTCF